MKLSLHHSLLILLFVCFIAACTEPVEHTASAVRARDSVAVMTSWGVNTLISDSGVIKYRIVAEKWEVNENKRPPRWIFEKGLFLEQFDEKFHVQAYIQCDTAYYYSQKKLWELRSRVRVRTKDGLRFTSQELFWDQNAHELYSNVFSRLVTPDRTLQGSYFRSDEKMTRYMVTNTKGSFSQSDLEGGNSDSGTSSAEQDSIQKGQRSQAVPERGGKQ
uniref:LPS export ABC transporter periplasmic protein LptC n=1 Tax=Prevotella sp. TaxID=59823 RepID=UPI004029754B